MIKKKSVKNKKHGKLIGLVAAVVLFAGAAAAAYFFIPNLKYKIFPKYNVTYNETEGVTFQPLSPLSVSKGSSFEFKVIFAEGILNYASLGGITANGELLNETDGKYTVTNINDNILICVSGYGTEGLTFDGTVLTGGADVSELIIPRGITQIGDKAFKSKNELVKVIIPDTVTEIGMQAFDYCANLTEINIGDGVKSIDSYAFNNTAWYNGKPEGLIYLGNWLYSYKSISSALPESLTFAEGTVGIADDAFIELQFNEIIVPAGVKYIGKRAFTATAIKQITLPESMESIGELAFAGCQNLTDIYIPENVRTIGKNAFTVCSNLQSVVIPKNVTVIEDGLFSDCGNLKEVTLTAQSLTFKNYAFVDNKNLKKISIYAIVPPVYTSGFFPSDTLFLIYVPEQSLNAYKTAEGWSVFQNQIFADTNNPNT